MDTVVVWVIIALFFMPLHYLPPLMVIFFRTQDPASRRRAMRAAIIDCTASMAVTFALVIWLSADHMMAAMLVLLLAILAPYPRILLRRPPAADAGMPS